MVGCATRASTWRVASGLAALLVVGCAAGPGGPTLELDTAWLWIGHADGPPQAGDPGWVARTLPDAWSPAERARSREGWYRMGFELPQRPQEAWAVHLSEVRMNAAVYLNGVAIGDGGRFAEPVARNWNRPLYFALPIGLLRAGENTLHVRLVVSPTSEPRLAPPWLGPDELLRPYQERRHFFQITLRQLSVALILGTSGVILFVAMRREAARSGLWFAATFLFAAFGHVDGFVRDIPVSTSLWQWANTTAYLAAVGCLLVGVHRLLGIQAPRRELTFAAGAVVLSALVGLVQPYAFVTVSTGVLFLMTGAMAYVIALVVRRGSRGTGWRVLLFGAALTLIGLHDMLAFTWPGEVRWVGMVPLVLVVFASWTLLDYLLGALREAEQLNAELDHRVEEKHQELEESYERMRVLERQRALAGERERVVREMHDGMGGMLVSTLALVEAEGSSRQRVGESLREVLDEMRLVMDSLDAGSDELVQILANLRARIAPRLARHDLVMSWAISPDLESPHLEPEAVHQLLRIVQEAINNVIQHARAHAIMLRLDSPGGPEAGFVLEIADDGAGFAPDPSSKGRGIHNMERRAREMGGHLEIDRSEQGTVVRLRVPGRRSPPPD